jgi:hypothetical protein
MDPDAAMRAVTRFIACEPDTERATVVAVMEAWEAGLLSHVEESGGLIEGLGLDLGCAAWRCAAEAEGCGDYEAECRQPGRREPCTPAETSCVGTTLFRCANDGSERRALIDCARFGATCDDGLCRLGDCGFGRDYYHLECEGNALTLCGGALRMDCGAWSPGSSCASFYIGGEVPTQWCSPSGMGEAGGYSRPVECDGRTIRFVSVSGREHALDCIANGYSSCDERGCVP